MAGVGNTGIPNAGGPRGVTGAATGLRSLVRTNANVKRATVAMPNRADYAPGVSRPVVQGPSRSDFGEGPTRKYVDEAARDVRRFRNEYNDPTRTSAFSSLMGLAQEQTASAEGEINREGREAASRAGYTGGFGARGKAAARDRMSAIAETGFKGAAQIREEAAGMYDTARGSLDAQVGSYNQAQTAINTAFGNALASSRETQGSLDLGFAGIVAQSNLSFAETKAQAQQLQAQLDQAYNSSLIDNAKYTQMQRSLDNEFAMAQAALKEKARQFDVTQGNVQQERSDRLTLEEKGMRSAGIDPTTGKRFGWANPAGRLGGMSNLR